MVQVVLMDKQENPVQVVQVEKQASEFQLEVKKVKFYLKKVTVIMIHSG